MTDDCYFNENNMRHLRTAAARMEAGQTIVMKDVDDMERKAKIINTIRQFRLIDDTYFNMFMEDNIPCMELFLRLILSNPTLRVERIQTQREVSNIFGRSVRFDVFTRNDDGTLCNMEVQRSDQEATPERARFNSCMLDMLTIKKGFTWGENHLPPACVIFITEHDVLRGGKPIYHISRRIDELEEKRFEDNAQIIYVNASYQDESPLGWLMHDMFANSPEKMHYGILADRTNYLKTDTHGVMKMCELMEKLMEEDRAKSFEKGREAEQQSTILRLFQRGWKLPDIMDATNLEKDKILNFLRANGIQPAQ